MRLWARLVVAKSGGIDDALIVFNMVSSLITFVFTLTWRRYH
jgi:hypothetical protein